MGYLPQLEYQLKLEEVGEEAIQATLTVEKRHIDSPAIKALLEYLQTIERLRKHLE